jgi:hypothetical protein
MSNDIEAIRQSPRQYVDLETVEWLSDSVMVLEQQLVAKDAAIELYNKILLAAFPEGASGEVFDLWNAARIAGDGMKRQPDEAWREIAVLKAKLAAAEKDAKRYRWLVGKVFARGEATLVLIEEFGGRPLKGETIQQYMDRYIDEAIRTCLKSA